MARVNGIDPSIVQTGSVTKNLTDADLDALIAALREIPANPNLVPAPQLKQ